MTSFDDPQQKPEVERRPARNVFDTADYPLPKGTSPRDVTSRHLLYESKEFALDIRHERQAGTTRASLVGHLADREDPLKALAGVKVSLVSEEKLLGETISDRMGEFRIEYDQHRWMALRVDLDEGDIIEVPIDRRTRKRPHDAPLEPPRRGREQP